MSKLLEEFEIDKELLDGFLDDSFEIIRALKDNLSAYVTSQDPKHFELFGQGIDRIMGAAYTLGFKLIGDLSKLGKEIGYKASQITDIHKLLTVHSLLAQLVKETEKCLKRLVKSDDLLNEESQTLLEKLESVNSKLGNLRTSVKF